MLMTSLGAGVTIIFFIIGLIVMALSIYALVLLIKALKIYIEKNSKIE